ncbi:MAG: hypothetical protein A2452_00875 [Candidatus Firestonebacteria bacterium RIFOXYC2_FULL_39_67]|nr:MAG: hypothetical protein A2536_10835 [Candidatus Firestonebacteria bacterium RIFOXYD2_FULL_39_29]OGF53397.1 MAG: hypothetical protein A2497_03250 [Candidatus Firestonebacteria bacterium RifOxyC12_full_39_7]OGF54753.1 MAG: hypothetical protein A2452_00875 [Candidatus Firestonebacteria bacterium RIFOXYC2_FULL_39_67]
MGLMKKIKEKIKESKFFFVSFTAHLLILFLVSGIVIVNPTMRKTVFRGILQMGGGGKAETPEWETQKQLPTSKPVDIPSTAKQEIKVTDAKVVINTKIADSTKSTAAAIKPLDIVGAGGGEGGGMGTGIGKGIGAGIGIFSARMNRTEMAKKYGGSPVTEAAVNKGLEYLFKVQKADGSWEGKEKYGMGSCANTTNGISGLCTLAFLGAGYRVDSPHKYAKTLRNAVSYLVNQQDESGGIGTPNKNSMYTHFIDMIALSEAYSVGGASGIKTNVQKATEFVLNAQGNNLEKAWRYGSASTDADLSVTGWGIMALKDAYYAGIMPAETKTALDDAIKFVIKTKGCYLKDGKGPPLPWVGLFCLALGNKMKTPLANDLIRQIDKVEISRLTDFYTIYYMNLASFQAGGATWERWNKQFRDYIVSLQNEDGSFQQLPRINYTEKTLPLTYSTAMVVLSLEVYYRYIPLYQIAEKEIKK